MDIDPKVEPWLIALLDGVQNSNHSAEVAATAAYAAPALVKALEGLLSCPDIADLDAEDKDPETADAERDARAALARGETP